MLFILLLKRGKSKEEKRIVLVDYISSMDAPRCQERATSRFEKIVRFYWDGVPIPPFVIRDGDTLHRTFILKQLNYSPDYYGEVQELPLVEEVAEQKGFIPLSKWEKEESTVSCRIAAHHSPNVGLFKYPAALEDLKYQNRLDEENCKSRKEVTVIRIPADPCDLPEDWDDEIRWKYRMFIRSGKLLELYVPIVKEYSPMSINSLRRIVVLATVGISPHKKEHVVRETLNVKDEYTRWMCQYVFYYMCTDPLFSGILSPLQLCTRPDPVPYTIISLSKEDRALTQANFARARRELQESIVWKADTRAFFLALRTLWNSRLRRIVFFDLTTKEWMTDAESFTKQLRNSLRSAFARIRIEFYSYVEEFFFTYVISAKDVLRMNEAELNNSEFQRIFIATRMFLVTEVRKGLLDGLEKVVEFFTCFGNFRHTCKVTRRIARKYPVIGVNLIVGESSTPRAPDFSNLVTGIRSLFDEFLSKLNELPRIEYVLLPTIPFKKEPVQFITETEVACYRASLMEVLDEAATTIDTVSALYGNYSALPSKDASIAKRGDTKEIKEHIALLRGKYHDVPCTTTDIVFCGRFAIKCAGLKRHYADKWEGFLIKFYDELHKGAMNVIDRAEERCVRAQQAVRQPPATVSELESYLVSCASAQQLTETLRVRDCQEVIRRIACLEEAQVPIENYLYLAAEKLMKWPQILQQDLAASEVIKEKCRPVLQNQVEQLRRETRDLANTLSTGVTELYNINHVDWDIAALTCVELRFIVESMQETAAEVLHQEQALGIPSGDTFEDLYPLVNHFDIIEQFWIAMNDATALKEYYASPVTSLNMKMIESAREWRRLIHCSTRNLRGYPTIFRLGQQQEVVLANFEGLEEFISVITTPGLRKNHWKEIARLVQAKLQDDVVFVTDMSISLQRLLDADILLHMNDLKRIVSQARGDFEVESTLEQMKSSAKKIHFRVDTLNTSEVSTRPHVPEECHCSILGQIEDYIRTCRNLRWKTGLSSAIMKALNEWEAATEKTKEMLIEWRKIEEEWSPLHNYLVMVQKSQKKHRKAEMVPLHERLTRAHDAFHQLHVKIGKPQFSLYMAIVQETVMEHLTAAKTALGELRPLMSDVLEKKRIAFPRFNFLTEDQLLMYLSTYNISELKLLLPHMYPRLMEIEVKDNCVVGFTTIDGSSIKAHGVIPLTDSLQTEWMVDFDKVLSRSVVRATKECCLEFGKGSLDTWIEGHCPQMLMMALRVVHTSRMRKALSFAGIKGLKAYQTQLKNLKDELCRLCMFMRESKKRDKIYQTLSYLFNAELDASTAVDKKISSLAELDGTTMVQTFADEKSSKTRILGVDFENGTEFYGSISTEVVMTPEIIERMVILLVLTLMGKSTPMVCGPKRRILPFIVVSLLGRFFLPVQCFSMLLDDEINRYLRGAIQLGAVVCFHDTENLTPETRTHLHEIVAQVTTAIGQKGRFEELSLSLPIGPEGTSVTTPIHRQFHAMLTCSSFDRLPRSIAFESRPIQMPYIDCSSIIRGYLYSFGYPEEVATSLQFGSMYQLFSRTRPAQFTMRILMHIVKTAAEGSRLIPLIEKLCDTFLRFFYTLLRDDAVLQKLFMHCVTQVVTLDLESPSCQEMIQKLKTAERPNTNEVFSRFVDLITNSTRVILSGPPFSGKSKLWKKWVGSAKHFIFSPSLTSSAELFGTPNHVGLLATLGKTKDFSAYTYCIIEGGAYLRSAFWIGIEDYSRLLLRGRGYIVGNSSFIITTRRLHQMEPSTCSIFSLFNLDVLETWQTFLKKCLTGAPYAEIAVDVMEIVLESLFKAIQEETPMNLSSIYFDDSHLLAASQRCANLYRRWYEHSKKKFDISEADPELAIDERAFAGQCAILASCWGVGLSLPMQDRDAIENALINSDTRLGDLMENYDVTERLLPSPGQNNRMNILELVCTPCGWKTHGEATQYGFTYPWSTFVNMNPQQVAWNQVFKVPSRLQILKTAECLMDCGQNIVFGGEMGSGKSTLLRTTRVCDRWSPLVISCSRGCNPTFIQENICSRLTRQSDGIFGPLIGRKLVVCIDDINLSPLLEESLPMAAQIIAFSNKFNCITTPYYGYIPVKNIVYLGTTDHERLHCSASRYCVEIFLPPLTGEELAAGLWELFEGCCAKKRVELFPRQGAAFIAIAHSYFLRVSQHIALPDRKMYISGYDALLREALELFPQRFRDALRASDVFRSNLLTSIPDVQVATTAFKYVDELYSAMLLAECPEGVHDFRDNLINVAEVTLGICAQDLSFQDLVDHNEILFTNCSPAVMDTVSNWIFKMEQSVELMKTDILENVMIKGQSAFDYMNPENANRSIMVSYPSLMSSVGKGATQMTRKGSGRVRSARHGGGSGIMSMSRTYNTTWLASHASFLAKALRNDDMHFVFTSGETFGCQRLLRIVCCATCMPLAVFRNKRPGYEYENFKSELKATISFAVVNDTPVVVYIPSGLLSIDGVPWVLDSIMRTGEVSELYSKEEQTALTKGYHIAQRSLRQLTVAEAFELRRRVQNNLHFILHVDSPAELEKYTLNFPSMRNLFPLSLHTPAGDAALRFELIQAILADEDTSEVREERAEFEKKFGSNAEVSRLICLVYDEVCSKIPTKGEQLIEFGHLVRKFRQIMVKRIQHNANMTNVVSNHGYGDEGVEDISTRIKETNQKLLETQNVILELNNRYKMEETAHSLCVENAEAAKAKLSEEQVAMSAEEQHFQEEETKLKHLLNAASHALKKAKAQSIRNLNQSRAPEKATLLVKAVYRTLGEEMPKGTNNRTELWNQALKLLCKASPPFGETLTAVGPDDVPDPNSLLALYNDLSEVRYTGSLEYAQTITDYILAIMNILRHREAAVDARQKSKADSSRSDLHILLSKAESARSLAQKTADSIKNLEKTCEELRESQGVLEAREVMLSKFVTLVDKFAEFVVATDSRTIDCVEGDIILVGAIFSLLIMHRDLENMYQQLQRILLERGIRTTLRWENAVKQLLFPGQSRQVDSFLPNGLPRRHRLVLYSLMARTVWRWPLIGGVCDIFEESINEYLTFECGECVVISAFDPTARNEIIQALKDGSGLIVRDIINVAAADLVRPLNDVLQRINEVRQKNAEGAKEKKFNILLYGKEIEVDIRFFMVCISSSLIPCDVSSPMTQWFQVVNLPIPLSRSYRFERLLFHAPTIKNLQEDVGNKRMLLYDEIFAFIRAYDCATNLISDHYVREDAGRLKRLEEVIDELTLHYGNITQYVGQIQALTKQQRDSWIPVEGAIKRASHILRFLEFSKLERPWNDSCIDMYVRRMCTLSPHLVARLAPQIFAEITIPEKHFYAILNFLENVLRGFNQGWPYSLRSIFSLLLVNGVTCSTEEVLMHRGYLFPTKVEMLNTEQVDVLRLILSDDSLKSQCAKLDDDSALKVIVTTFREYYANSGDPLLMGIAKDTLSTEESSLENFFCALLDFNLKRAEMIAEQLVDSFFAAVRDNKWLTSESGRRDDDQISDVTSSGGGGGHGVLPPLRSIRGEADLFQQAVAFCIPICIETHYNDSDLILRRIPNYAQVNGFHYRWFNISSSQDLKRMPEVILTSFYYAHPNTHGHGIALHIDLPDRLLKPWAELNGEDREELRHFIIEFERTMVSYNGRRNLVGKYTKVSLLIVISQNVHDVLWCDNSNHGDLSLLRCMYFSRVFITPQRHLLDLLNTHPSLSRASWDRKTRGTSQMSARSGRSYDSGEQRTMLESMTLLVAKELTVVHLAMSQRTRMVQLNWLATHHSTFPDLGGRQLMNDENLTLLLQLLRGWLNEMDLRLYEKEQSTMVIPTVGNNTTASESSGSIMLVHGSRTDTMLHSPLSSMQPSFINHDVVEWGSVGGGKPTGESKSEIQNQVASIFSLPDNREHAAYLFYRKQLRSFRHFHRFGGAAGPSLAISSRSHVTVTEDATNPPENPLEAYEAELSITIFNTFQKFAYEVLSCYEMSRSEAKALQWLLKKLVVAPSSSAVVSCHYTDLMPRCPLLLDADSDFNDFELEVAEMQSDLVELCGDGMGTVEFRRDMEHRMRDLFFSFTQSARTSEETTPQNPSIETKPSFRGHSSMIPPLHSSSALAREAVPRVHSSIPDRRLKTNSASPFLGKRSSDSAETRPTSSAGVGGFGVRNNPVEWRHDIDSLRRSHVSLRSQDSQMLSKRDLATENDLRESHSEWLRTGPSSPDSKKNITTNLPWVLEKENALDLMQFYSSTKSTRPRWEKKLVLGTYRCIAAKTFVKEKSVSLWLPAIRNPVVTLHLVCSAIREKLNKLFYSRADSNGSEWFEVPVRETIIIVTQRQLLCTGDVVLKRAFLSRSLEKNIQAVTEWEDGFFENVRGMPGGGEGEGESEAEGRPPAPTDIVIAVRMMTVKTLPPHSTVAMLESPITPDSKWEKPTEVVVKSYADNGARAFSWMTPQKIIPPPPPSQRRESRTTDRRLSAAVPANLFFTSIDIEASTRGRKNVFHMLSSTPIDIFYETRGLGKFKKKEEGDVSGLLIPPPVPPSTHKHSPTPETQSLMDRLNPVEDDTMLNFDITKTWNRMLARPLCLIWEKDEVMVQTTVEIPKDGLVEYYIYIQ